MKTISTIEEYNEFIDEMLKDKNGVIQYRNINASRCYKSECNRELKAGEGYRIYIAGKGVRVVCDNHYCKNGALGYHGNANRRRCENDAIIGTPKKTSLAKTPVGVEFETNNVGLSDVAYTSARALIEECFLVRGEYDCSITGLEFPTEKMRGLATMSKVLQSLEGHGLLKPLLYNDKLGAHIHVQCECVPYVRRYYHSIFLPLARYIEAMGEDRRVEVFGSDFRGYAHMINEHSEPTDHSNIFNTQHEHTLEFRLPRVSGYKQYLEVVKFWREVVFAINNYDFHEDGDATTRKMYARKCGDKLVEVAKKYF